MKYIKQIKSFLSDKKKRSVTILGLYLLFFVFVFAIINSSKKEIIKLEGIDAFSNSQNYKLEVNNLVIENNKVYINSVESVIPEELKKYNLKPKDIYDIVKKSTLESTNYINNTDTFIIKESDLYNVIGIVSDSNEIIKITVCDNVVTIYFSDILKMEVK